jgi:hypothetical protein
MLGALFRFAYMMPTRLRIIGQILNDPLLSQSYYPELPRKSKGQMLVDYLKWLFRHQEVNFEYHYYGMDCVGGEDDRTYLARNEFR